MTSSLPPLRLREEQRRARHGFSTARALPGEPTDAPNMAIKRDVEQTEKRCLALPKKCKHWGHTDTPFNRNVFQVEFVDSR